jgi:molybdenum cofactor sulfurtransferase
MNILCFVVSTAGLSSKRSMLIPLGTTYLDHAGTTLPSRSLVNSFSRELRNTLLSNPHSSSSSSPNTSERVVAKTRREVLRLFKADEEYFDVIFLANATAGIKLVLEGFSGNEQGFDYYYHRDSHTSLVGIRELAHYSHCLESDAKVEAWINTQQGNDVERDVSRPTLFAYPAQSNMNGRRLPLSWPSTIYSNPHHQNTYTLLDVAALVSTSPLDLSNHISAPDFTVLSFYKMFGFPDLGALIVRKSAAHVFDKRKYFGGGTTEMVACTGQPWVERKTASLHERLEDGTGAVHSILALQCAMRTHEKLFGGFEVVSRHTGWLARCLYERLSVLKYGDGTPVCRIYKDPASTYGDEKTQGATIAFNIRRDDGTWFGSSEVGGLAITSNIHIRTGSLCNPAGMSFALGIGPIELKKIYEMGFRCGQEHDVINEMPLGMVRISFGAMSTLKDVELLMAFINKAMKHKDIGVATSAAERVEDGSTLCGGVVEGNKWSMVGRRALQRAKRHLGNRTDSLKS